MPLIVSTPRFPDGGDRAGGVAGSYGRFFLVSLSGFPIFIC